MHSSFSNYFQISEKNAVLTKEMPDNTGATLENSPRKCPAWSAQQKHVSRTKCGEQLKAYIYGHIK
jgi:hypothetical protein